MDLLTIKYTYIHTYIYTEGEPEGKSKGFIWNLQNKLRSTGWLNLLADAMHNFTDGIAIGMYVWMHVCMYVCTKLCAVSRSESIKIC